MVDRVLEELRKEVHNLIQETVTKTIPKKKKCKKAKWLSDEALQIAEERREAKDRRKEKRYTQLNVDFQRLAMRDRRRQWHPTPVLLPGKSQGWRSLVGFHLWGCTELDTTEVT